MPQSILKYSSLQKYLLDFVKESKKKKPTWSIANWSRRLGLKSTTSITMIMNGQRKCGRTVSSALMNYFRFTEAERKHFLFLISMSKMERDNPTRILLEKEVQVGVKAKKVIHLDESLLSQIKSAHFFSLRQLARIMPLKKEESWLRAKLQYNGPANLLESASRLSKLGFLQDNGTTLTATDANLLSETEMSSETIKKYHEEMGTLGIQAIRRYEVSDRSFQGCTLKIQKNKVGEAKNLIEKFMDEFELLTDDDEANAIYQLNLQFFPLVVLDA